MKVLRTPGSIELRSTPGCLWGFGLWFVAGGSLCLGMAAFRADELGYGARAIIALIGSGVLAGGLFQMATTPATSLAFDLVRRRVRYVRRAPLRRRVIIDVPAASFHGYALVTSTDSDGDPRFDLNVLFEGRRPQPLDNASGRAREHLDRTAALIAEARASL